MRQFEYLPVRPPVGTIDAFLKDVDEVRREVEAAGSKGPWYFRGDQRPSDLRPHVGRPQTFADKTTSLLGSEYQLLNRFKRFGYQEFNRAASDWEALFLARHYDLPTRILDWTASPLVALYFSCSARKPDVLAGTVWGILRQPDIPKPIDVFDLDPNRGPFTLYASRSAIKIVFPMYNSGRIVAQRGLFTWHSEPAVALDSQAGQSLDDDLLDIVRLVQWPIQFTDNTNRGEMLRGLERLGFSSRTVLPDLAGIVAGLWQTEVLFS